jgi:hypothetical protein
MSLPESQKRPDAHEHIQNVMLFAVRFGLLFRQRNIKYLLWSLIAEISTSHLLALPLGAHSPVFHWGK